MKSAYDVLNVVSCDSLQQTIDQLRHEKDSLQALVVTPAKTNKDIHLSKKEFIGGGGLIVFATLLIVFLFAMIIN